MKKIVVLSGAGISAESGISTFRDAGGLWDKYPVQQVASIDGYNKNPALVIDFYNQRRKELFHVTPNAAHQIVHELEEKYEVTVVTQNIDNLHERAGSSKIIHLHGELTKICSSKSPYNPRFIKQLTPNSPELKVGDLAPDGSQYRPFIVWFGEAVPQMDRAIEETKEAAIFIIIGTSLNVYPAASLLHYIPQTASVYLIDPKEVNMPSDRTIQFIQKSATEGMKALKKILL
ncbi:MAG: Sir2 family NAD-dependent protein deacetylase [Bacteroidaceae bacterium]|nr:NAD-dependent protein deacylase [Bacteroidaceae bacterium]